MADPWQRVDLVARHLDFLPCAPATAPTPFPKPLVTYTSPSAQPDLQTPVTPPLPVTGERFPGLGGAEADWEAVKHGLEAWKADIVYMNVGRAHTASPLPPDAQCPFTPEDAQSDVDRP